MMTTLASQTVYNSLGATLAVTNLCNLVFNGCCILVILKNYLQSPIKIFIMVLSICDIAVALSNCIVIFKSFFGRFESNSNLCVFEGFLVFSLGLTSMYILTAISFNRYIILVRPIQASKITKRVALLCSATCFMLGFSWACIPFLGWNRYVLVGIHVSCSIDWHSSDIGNMSYIFTILFFCFIFPLAVIVFSYGSILCVSPHRNNVSDENIELARQQNILLEGNGLSTSIIIVSAFLISWTPYAIVSFIPAFGFAYRVSNVAETYIAVFAKLSGVWNPVILFATNKRFRIYCYNVLPQSRLKSKLLTWEDNRDGYYDEASTTRPTANTTL